MWLGAHVASQEANELVRLPQVKLHPVLQPLAPSPATPRTWCRFLCSLPSAPLCCLGEEAGCEAVLPALEVKCIPTSDPPALHLSHKES